MIGPSDEDEVRIRDYELYLERMEKTILDILNTNVALVEIDLLLRVMRRLNPQLFRNEEFLVIIRSLVDRKEIEEVYYRNEDTTGHIYFKKGTSILK